MKTIAGLGLMFLVSVFLGRLWLSWITIDLFYNATIAPESVVIFAGATGTFTAYLFRQLEHESVEPANRRKWLGLLAIFVVAYFVASTWIQLDDHLPRPDGAWPYLFGLAQALLIAGLLVVAVMSFAVAWERLGPGSDPHPPSDDASDCDE